MEEKNIESVSKKLGQIDFVDALNHVIGRKKLVFKYLIISFIIGVLLVLLTPKEYESSAIILPQISSNKGLSKKYSSIASLVGIDLGQPDGNKIVPTLYPIIAEGAPFQKEILQKKINIKEVGTPITLYEYLQKYKTRAFLDVFKEYTIGLPGKIFRFGKGNDTGLSQKVLDSTLYQYSKKEKQYISFLEHHLIISFDENDGFIKIKATMREPVAAAQLVKNAQNLLQKFIIDYNIKKSQDELKFIEERLVVVREEYREKRSILGNYRDRNKNGILSSTKNREEQLKSEYDLVYNMYSELSSKRESAKLQVEKDTPIFTELQPALVNFEPSAPNVIKVIVGAMLIGVLIGITWILLRFLAPLFLDYLTNKED